MNFEGKLPEQVFKEAIAKIPDLKLLAEKLHPNTMHSIKDVFESAIETIEKSNATATEKSQYISTLREASSYLTELVYILKQRAKITRNVSEPETIQSAHSYVISKRFENLDLKSRQNKLEIMHELGLTDENAYLAKKEDISQTIENNLTNNQVSLYEFNSFAKVLRENAQGYVTRDEKATETINGSIPNLSLRDIGDPEEISKIRAEAKPKHEVMQIYLNKLKEIRAFNFISSGKIDVHKEIIKDMSKNPEIIKTYQKMGLVSAEDMKFFEAEAKNAETLFDEFTSTLPDLQSELKTNHHEFFDQKIPEQFSKIKNVLSSAIQTPGVTSRLSDLEVLSSYFQKLYLKVKNNKNPDKDPQAETFTQIFFSIENPEDFQAKYDKFKKFNLVGDLSSDEIKKNISLSKSKNNFHSFCDNLKTFLSEYTNANEKQRTAMMNNWAELKESVASIPELSSLLSITDSYITNYSKAVNAIKSPTKNESDNALKSAYKETVSTIKDPKEKDLTSRRLSYLLEVSPQELESE